MLEIALKIVLVIYWLYSIGFMSGVYAQLYSRNALDKSWIIPIILGLIFAPITAPLLSGLRSGME